jgi:hypothetical protein
MATLDLPTRPRHFNAELDRLETDFYHHLNSVMNIAIRDSIREEAERNPHGGKKRIIWELCLGIANEMMRSVDNGKIPEEWDGHELRELFYMKAKFERSPWMMDGRKPRKRKFMEVWASTPNL